MPKYMPNDDEMDETYGGGGIAPPKEAESEESVDQEAAETNTTIVPNSILSPEGEPLKEGDEIVVRVVKNYGDESEIEYAPKEGGGEYEVETMEEPMSTEGAELAALAGESE